MTAPFDDAELKDAFAKVAALAGIGISSADVRVAFTAAPHAFQAGGPLHGFS
jgi:hypothetical protein